MKNSFNELGISSAILKALHEMGYEKPTEVQSRAIPHILNKEDLMVLSKTGSGKTAVFAIPLLQMTEAGITTPQALILTPTRELAVQVDNAICHMSKHLSHKTTAVYGQHNMNREIETLKQGVSIVTGTPGRIYDHIQHGNLKTKDIRFLVLDEADRMMDMGFFEQVERIIKTLPRDRVNLLFSATLPSEIRKICQKYMKNPITIEIESPTKTVDSTKQRYYRVEKHEKNTQLNRILMIEQPESCMIFCNTRIAVDKVHTFLSRKGLASAALHGDIPQGKRLKTIQDFKDGEFHLLVATDVAARGIHIEALPLVINYDVPLEKDSYVHRIGRTGRAGNVGQALSLVTGDDIMSLYEIEEHIGAMILEEELPTEGTFHEKIESVEQWIQRNSLKTIPKKSTSLRKVSATNSSEKQNKYSNSKPPQTYGKDKNTYGGINSNRNTVKKENSPGPNQKIKKISDVVNPVSKITNSYSKKEDSRSKTKPSNTRGSEAILKKIDTHPTVMPKPLLKGSSDIVQGQDSVAKKPFLQRLIHRIFGKKN